ncbi:hypothetical protein VCRA2119O48_40008 [Vibrio crassostreae]|nr:hypothetical protein VCHA39P226_120144 [Vibrio chagasii]CAK2504619.1 hypothetical protein VCRA2119O48_40008 [Vibrio crassostreae]CAH6942146.1 hypothetical protein VCHA52P453_110144 [Vibrio chagasii]CAH7312399.1 hypothetical protein VCHA52P456_40143 [Vibrio chagasii]CAK3516561.1 hypothetical protein VCRA2120E330_400022 [Vibrio crassostreae]
MIFCPNYATKPIETLPRITPKFTSKITSPDYPHEFTDVDGGATKTKNPASMTKATNAGRIDLVKY